MVKFKHEKNLNGICQGNLHTATLGNLRIYEFSNPNEILGLFFKVKFLVLKNNFLRLSLRVRLVWLFSRILNVRI